MDAIDRTEPRRHAEDTRPRELSWDSEPERGPITRDFAVALMRALVAEAGREEWSPWRVMCAFDELRDQEPASLRRAAYRVLDHPGSTPEDIALAGEHWSVTEIPQAAPKLALVPDLPAASRACSKHPDVVWADCRVCRPLSKGRSESWWAERDRVAKEDAQRREALDRQRIEEALAADRKRLARLGTQEPEHA